MSRSAPRPGAARRAAAASWAAGGRGCAAASWSARSRSRWCCSPGSGLLIRSFTPAAAAWTRASTRGARSRFRVSLPESAYADDAQRRRLPRRARDAPAARSPACARWAPSSGLPLGGSQFNISFTVDGPARAPAGAAAVAGRRDRDPRLLPRDGDRRSCAGRGFERRRRRQGAAGRGAERGAVRRHFPDEDPIGKRSASAWAAAGQPKAGGEVVGVVRDVKRQRPRARRARPRSTCPTRSSRRSRWTSCCARDVPPRSLATAAERVVHELDAELPVARVATLEEVVRALDLGAALLHAAARRLRGHGALPRGARPLRRDVLRGRAAHARARRCAWRSARASRSCGAWCCARRWCSARSGSRSGSAARSLLSRTLTTLLFSVSPSDPATLAARRARCCSLTTLARGLPAGPARHADRPGGRAARGLRARDGAWRRASRSAG